MIGFGCVLRIALLGYLIGALPTAYTLAQAHGIDIFAVGSGNMGATNIARALGARWGILVWLLDGFKGIGAILLAQALLPDAPELAATTAALAAIVGHNWSIYLFVLSGQFRGGKGASTAFGTLLLIAPPYVFAVLSAVGLVIIAVTRYVSLASLAIFILGAVWILILSAQALLPGVFAVYAVALAGLILVRFRGNIARLIAGTERRIGRDNG